MKNRSRNAWAFRLFLDRRYEVWGIRREGQFFYGWIATGNHLFRIASRFPSPTGDDGGAEGNSGGRQVAAPTGRMEFVRAAKRRPYGTYGIRAGDETPPPTHRVSKETVGDGAFDVPPIDN